MMDQDLIDIKSKAMAFKMMRFTMKSIAITGYYGDTQASITFVDSAGYIWHVSDSYGTLISFHSKSEKDKDWLRSVSKRKTTTDLHERYRATLVEGIDYAMAFDWLLDASKKNGMLSICKLSGYVSGEKIKFEKFFMPTDSPEALMIQFDLYANRNVTDDRI